MTVRLLACSWYSRVRALVLRPGPSANSGSNCAHVYRDERVIWVGQVISNAGYVHAAAGATLRPGGSRSLRGPDHERALLPGPWRCSSVSGVVLALAVLSCIAEAFDGRDSANRFSRV
jgi:hypothetical protein